ncbi:MAG TPA: DUF4388 domain-containing protein, partial [Candidatus Krumholzibacterium sp.]|nr:DUF4388 domain-containing protein [Candidatus Krumholzibacterium sp.]
EKAVSMMRSNIAIVISAIACVLLVILLKKKSTVKSYPLQGSLTLIPILDIVSLLNANLKTGRLVVSVSRDRGEIFFEKGEIVHARFKSHDGRKAFHAMMVLKSGKYVFYNHLPNVKHTISEPLSLLLLSMKSTEEPPAPIRKKRPAREKAGV